MNKKWFFLLIAVWLVPACLTAGVVSTFKYNETPAPRRGLAGNGVTDLQRSGDILWIGTGYGLSRLDLITDEMATFSTDQGLGHGSVAALWVQGDTIIVATATDTITQVDPAPLPKGTGLSFSFDNGTTWRRVPQPGATPIQNLTYDIAVLNETVWITSWGGGVQKSADWGETWQEAPPDSFNFDPFGKYNHRGFAAVAGAGSVWIGTAEGINKSPDNGMTWSNFNHYSQPEPISGNFVVALGYQETKDQQIIWAATWKAEGEDEFYAVSRTVDGGLTWKTFLSGEKAHNFAFDDSVVYVATDNGLFASHDFGQNWYLFPPMTDTVTGERVYSSEVYSAVAANGELWVGTADGLARTRNNGYTWDIFRAYPSTGQNGEKRTYAYPNPFSPMRHNQLGGDGYVRFQYNTKASARVTVKVFDFAMDLVTTVVDGKYCSGPGDYAEVWNGRNDFGDAVANGVYFYSIEIDGDGTYWGKVLIVN